MALIQESNTALTLRGVNMPDSPIAPVISSRLTCGAD